MFMCLKAALATENSQCDGSIIDLSIPSRALKATLGWSIRWAYSHADCITMGKEKYTQYAALPYRIRDGVPEFMLVTTRGNGRWIIPKGWAERGLPPRELAAEAFEEAGLIGAISEQPVGRFRYSKALRSGRRVVCEATVFPLLAERQLEDWPERGQRKTCWLKPEKAALRVRENTLSDLLRNFERTISGDLER